MQHPDRLEVELVGAQVGLGHVQVAQDTGEPSDPRPHRPAQAHPNAVGHLRLQLPGRLSHERQRAVEEGRMLNAVVGKGLEAEAEPLPAIAGLLVDGVEQGVDLGQVARSRQRE